MNQTSYHRIVALLIAVACAALGVSAIFNGGGSSGKTSNWQDLDDLSLSSLWKSDAGITSAAAVRRHACPQCGAGINWGSSACPRCAWTPAPQMNRVALPSTPAGRAVAGAAALADRLDQVAAQTAAGAPGATALPSPREQNAAGKEFIEGHWLGLEVIPLAPELATEYRIPKGETGVLVDEITLEAAESGILAGDMVQSIDGQPTSDLRAFFLATQHVQEKARAQVGVSRRGGKMTFVIEARNTKTLGFAQMEAAQPIRPGALSPHRARGRACTACHIIMRTGGQLPTDAGDILPNPPPITRDAQAPHRYRGQCSSCHVIVK